MALDKLVDSTQLDSDLTSVANAIRTKGGTSAQLSFPLEFISAINAISGGGSYSLQLLASGTYTKTGSAGGISIPVTYTGTPKVAVIDTPTPLTATNQATYAQRYFHAGDPAEVLHDCCTAYRLNTSDTSGNVGIATSLMTLNTTTLDCSQLNTTYKWQPNTYKWYIFGVTS